MRDGNQQRNGKEDIGRREKTNFTENNNLVLQVFSDRLAIMIILIVCARFVQYVLFYKKQ